MEIEIWLAEMRLQEIELQKPQLYCKLRMVLQICSSISNFWQSWKLIWLSDLKLLPTQPYLKLSTSLCQLTMNVTQKIEINLNLKIYTVSKIKRARNKKNEDGKDYKLQKFSPQQHTQRKIFSREISPQHLSSSSISPHYQVKFFFFTSGFPPTLMLEPFSS